MTKKIQMLAITLSMALTTLSSCGLGIGKVDKRDRNIEKVMLAYLDSIPEVEYIGLSDTHHLKDGNFQAVIIYNLTDTLGNKVERNARVVTNNDGSEIYSWKDLDCQILNEVKQKVSDKFEAKGINLDGSLIDALIELKRR
ncbi:MAG: hypothetical protein HDR88_14815 [Bacteroides sp.]|nr:hypothetical protein [Bacteroides sp.]